MTKSARTLALGLLLAALACAPPPAEPASEAAIPPAELAEAAKTMLPQFLSDRVAQGYGDDLEIVAPETEVVHSNETDAAVRLTFFTRRAGKTDGVQWVIEVPLRRGAGGWTASKYSIQGKTAMPKIDA